MSVIEQKVAHTVQWPSERLAWLGYGITQAAMGAGCDANTFGNLVEDYAVNGSEIELARRGFLPPFLKFPASLDGRFGVALRIKPGHGIP